MAGLALCDYRVEVLIVYLYRMLYRLRQQRLK